MQAVDPSKAGKEAESNIGFPVVVGAAVVEAAVGISAASCPPPVPQEVKSSITATAAAKPFVRIFMLSLLKLYGV
jgi:hypothetical protein